MGAREAKLVAFQYAESGLGDIQVVRQLHGLVLDFRQALTSGAQ